MRRPRRSLGIEPLGDLLRRDTDLRGPAAIEACPVSPRDWEAAVGSRIAARARPVGLERGTLLVLAGSATWAQELSLLSDEILAQLRGRGLRIERLRFRVGRVDPPDRPPGRHDARKAPPRAPLPPELAQTLAKVDDAGLRDAIAAAASVSFGFQALGAVRPRRPSPSRRRPEPPEPLRADPPRSEPEPSRPPREPPRPDAGEPRGAPGKPATSATRGAPAPRSAARGSAPSDRSSPASRAARPRKP